MDALRGTELGDNTEHYHRQYSCQRTFTLKATRSLDSRFIAQAGGHSNKLTMIINQNMRHSTEQEARTLPKFKKKKKRQCYELEQTPGDTRGQETLASCCPWGHKESDRT